MKSRLWWFVGLIAMGSASGAAVAGQSALAEPMALAGQDAPTTLGGQAIDAETRAAMAAAAIDAILEGGDEEGRWGALTRVLGVQDVAMDLSAFEPGDRASPGTPVANSESTDPLAELRYWMSEAVQWRPATREEVAIATGVSFALMAIVTLILVGSVRTLRALVAMVFTGRQRSDGRAPVARAVSRRAPKRRGRGPAPALSRDAARLEARLRARRVA